MKTRCKFTVEKVTRYQGKFEQITLNAVHGGLSEEDKSFSAFTPSGKLEITVTNPVVVGTFEPGKSYYLDLIPVPEEKP